MAVCTDATIPESVGLPSEQSRNCSPASSRRPNFWKRICLMLSRWMEPSKPGGAAPRCPPDLPYDGVKAGDQLPVLKAYGYVWACLGEPEGDIFPIDEFAEPDRRNLNAASIGVNVSGPRAIENFLDMGHFPYVHTDILGVEPHTEVKEYNVEIVHDRDEVHRDPVPLLSADGVDRFVRGSGCRIHLPGPTSVLFSALQIERTGPVAHGCDRPVCPAAQ